MQISNRIAGTATQDSLANLAARAAGRTSDETAEGQRSSAFTAGSHDPSDRVSLSVEALFVLSASRDNQSLPALSEDERNNVVSTALEEREYAAFRHFREEGDMKSYYRAYIEYYDRLQPQDQSSPRYAGSRQIAVSALRSLAYAEKAMDDDAAGEAPAVIDTILAGVNTQRRDVPQMAAATAGLGAEAFRGLGVSHATSMYLASF
ncbi:biotin biosynthesis protein BioC [Mycoplana sp. MJR14]|uniref:biotin biosynthesis protein BioC n=1 Tax=Mycoplana sp. MJR14 TaxID=3032583 RepID=UPI000DDAA79D|nr:biotin biosynthesis protein BioC [Mycoplana sp. MJR14]MDF1633902.1 biotin biosynthesis protein BioC [Mycoplana sp. MJR14]